MCLFAYSSALDAKNDSVAIRKMNLFRRILPKKSKLPFSDVASICL